MVWPDNDAGNTLPSRSASCCDCCRLVKRILNVNITFLLLDTRTVKIDSHSEPYPWAVLHMTAVYSISNTGSQACKRRCRLNTPVSRLFIDISPWQGMGCATIRGRSWGELGPYDGLGQKPTSRPAGAPGQ